MVKLELESKVDQKKQPVLYSWDQSYRVSHSNYQNDIDQLTYHLQRSQRGLFFLGQWVYPRFFQKDVLNLEILQKKQWLGKVNQEEVEQFKRFNPDIASDLNKTFGAQWTWPTQGLCAGAALFAVGAVFNLRYSFRLGFLAFPAVIDFAMKQFDRTAGINTIEFLDWTTELRRERSRQELYALNNTVAPKDGEFKGPVWDTYTKIVDLVEKEGANA